MCAIAKAAVKKKSFIDLQLTRFFIADVVFDPSQQAKNDEVF